MLLKKKGGREVGGDLWVEKREGKQEKEALSLCCRPI